jgi:hypothetical protein
VDGRAAGGATEDAAGGDFAVDTSAGGTTRVAALWDDDGSGGICILATCRLCFGVLVVTSGLKRLAWVEAAAGASVAFTEAVLLLSSRLTLVQTRPRKVVREAMQSAGAAQAWARRWLADAVYGSCLWWRGLESKRPLSL